MNKQIFVNQLQEYGLDDREAQIYLYLLEAGPQTPLQLSREINIDRSKIYRSIDRLIDKGFVDQTHAAWGKKLQASSPSNMSLVIQAEEQALQTRKQSLPALVKELSSISTYVHREFEVKHYRGQEGLRQMLWNHLAAMDEILLFGFRNRNDIVGKTYAEKIRTEQVDRKIIMYEIQNQPRPADHIYTNVLDWDKFFQNKHIAPEILEIKQYIAIFNHTVSIINWQDGEEVGLEIINADYAETQRQLFWQTWKLAS